MKRTLFLVCLVGASLLMCGCFAGPVALVASTSPIEPGIRGSVPAYGSDCQYHLFGLIPIGAGKMTQEALVRAKASANADVLTDVTVDQSTAYYILFSNNCVKVQGLGVPRLRR